MDGKALIGFIRIPYVNGPTQETGVVTIARQMEYRIRQKWDYLLMLTDMLCLMSGMLFAASLLILLHTRYAMKKALDEQKANEDKEYRAIPEKIEKAKGSQKARAFEWGTQFKIFLIRRYRLDRTVLTEQEAAALLSHRSDIPEADGVKISGLHERLLSLKFSTKEWEEQPFERLKNDLLDFIRRRL